MRITATIFFILITIPLWSGCTAITGFNDFDFSSDGDGDSDGDADGDCIPTDEVCNNEDDDCDDEIDEDFDLLTDENNCGACDRVCPHVENGESVCINGDCTLVCADDYADCNGDGESCDTNIRSPDHCGDCDTECGDEEVCTQNDDGDWVCDSECSGTEENCGGLCVDTSTNTNHCGGCDNACEEVANASPSCVNGDCVADCDDLFGDCNGEYDDGCEQSLTESIENCGSCGESCPALANTIASCSADGTCSYICTDDYLNCDTSSDDCEAFIGASATCGDCETQCVAPRPICSPLEDGTGAYACVDDCPSGRELCGDTCVNLDTSPLHCGRCDNPCPGADHATPTCEEGHCGFDCWEDFDNCDDDPSNGCEAELWTYNHCSGCYDTCTVTNGSGRCETMSGAAHCEIADCDGNYGDCDDRFDTGCEVVMNAYVPDRDGDDHGDLHSSPSRYCSDEVPADYVDVSFADDCDDYSGDIYPGATEECNGDDDNCNGDTDESFPGMGEVCGSGEGECVPGVRTCVGGSEVCEGEIIPIEDLCDGLDNDCDGDADEDFPCALGETRTCTGVWLGCTYVSEQGCLTGSCNWDSDCPLPGESCNRTDDNCDEMVDESILTASSRTEAYPAYGADMLSSLRADYHPVDNQYVALWLAPYSGHQLNAVAVNTDGTSPSSYEAIYRDVVDADICFDGTEFTVVYITDIDYNGLNDVIAARVDTSLTVLQSYVISNNYPNTSEPTQVRCAHVTDTSGHHIVGVTWAREKEATGFEDWLMYIAIEAGSSTSSWTPIASSRSILEETIDKSVESIAIGGLDNGRFLIAAEIEEPSWSFGDDNALMVRVIESDGDIIESRAFEESTVVAQRDLEVAYDVSSNRAAVLFQYFSTGPTQQWNWLSVNTNNLADTEAFELGTNDRVEVANAGDSSFGFLSFLSISGVEEYVFTRYTPDGFPYPDVYDLSLYVGSIFLVGVPAGDERYAAFALEPPVADMQLVHNAIRCP